MKQEDFTELWIELGKIVHTGMMQVEDQERFTGPDVRNTYRTHFPMPDGREWFLSVAPMEKPVDRRNSRQAP